MYCSDVSCKRHLSWYRSSLLSISCLMASLLGVIVLFLSFRIFAHCQVSHDTPSQCHMIFAWLLIDYSLSADSHQLCSVSSLFSRSFLVTSLLNVSSVHPVLGSCWWSFSPKLPVVVILNSLNLHTVHASRMAEYTFIFSLCQCQATYRHQHLVSRHCNANLHALYVCRLMHKWRDMQQPTRMVTIVNWKWFHKILYDQLCTLHCCFILSPFTFWLILPTAEKKRPLIVAVPGCTAGLKTETAQHSNDWVNYPVQLW